MVDLQHETGISSDRSGHWRSGGLTDVEVGICEYIASREMEAAGYRLSGQKMPKLALMASISVLAVKTILILVLNWRRSRNLWEMMSRRLSAMGRA